MTFYKNIILISGGDMDVLCFGKTIIFVIECRRYGRRVYSNIEGLGA